MKKRRFFYMFLLYLVYKYQARFIAWVKARRLRSINKYKRRWITRYHPEAISYQTALDSAFPGQAFSQEVTDRLGEAFVIADSTLKNGFSRQLVINVLTRVRFSSIIMVFQMERMTDEQQKKFLSDSGYRTVRKRMLCSCSFKTFLELLATKLTSPEEELSFAEEFLRIL